MLMCKYAGEKKTTYNTNGTHTAHTHTHTQITKLFWKKRAFFYATPNTFFYTRHGFKKLKITFFI